MPRSCAGRCLRPYDIDVWAGEPYDPCTNAILNGQTWNFQAWHRDADTLPACNNNFTDAVEVTITP